MSFRIDQSLKNHLKTLIFTLFFLIITGCGPNESKPDNASMSNVMKPPPLCDEDIKTCPDGRSTKRNPKNNCQFHPCGDKKSPQHQDKKPLMCTTDVKECPNGSFIGRDPYNECKFKLCPPDKNGRTENPDH